MKTIIAFILVSLSGVAVAEDCIIDPEKVMVHASSEPLFMNVDEQTREVASNSSEAPSQYARNPDQYLEVLKTIPASEPKIERVWLEYKIMRED